MGNRRFATAAAAAVVPVVSVVVVAAAVSVVVQSSSTRGPQAAIDPVDAIRPPARPLAQSATVLADRHPRRFRAGLPGYGTRRPGRPQQPSWW